MFWILLAALAAPLQVARNAAQRGLVAEAGPWGATLVRFLFGLPFSLAVFAVAALLTPDARPQPSLVFWGGIGVGAIAQVLATAALLTAMGRSGFAVATMMQQSSLPLAALMGWLALGDDLSVRAWVGIAVATAGLAVLSWPRRADGRDGAIGALLGLASGAAFAVAFNGFRQAGLAFEPAHPLYAATAAVVAAQALQSLVMTIWLGATRPQAFRAIRADWRSSLGAGMFGSAASVCWFGALALSPAGPVRAVGLIEGPVAALVGRRLFRERLGLRKTLGATLSGVGLILVALG